MNFVEIKQETPEGQTMFESENVEDLEMIPSQNEEQIVLTEDFDKLLEKVTRKSDDDEDEPPKKKSRRKIEKFRCSSSEASRQESQLYSDQSSSSSNDDGSKNEPIKLSRHKNIDYIKFFQALEKHPCLYDKNHAKYDHTSRAAAKSAVIIAMGFEVDSKVRKFDNMMGYARRNFLNGPALKGSVSQNERQAKKWKEMQRATAFLRKPQRPQTEKTECESFQNAGGNGKRTSMMLFVESCMDRIQMISPQHDYEFRSKLLALVEDFATRN